MKKILLVHTSYQNLGGEDVAVENEITLLKNHFEVETLIFSNNVQNYFSQFIYFIFNKNFKSMRILQEKFLLLNLMLFMCTTLGLKAQ